MEDVIGLLGTAISAGRPASQNCRHEATQLLADLHCPASRSRRGLALPSALHRWVLACFLIIRQERNRLRGIWRIRDQVLTDDGSFVDGEPLAQPEASSRVAPSRRTGRWLCCSICPKAESKARSGPWQTKIACHSHASRAPESGALRAPSRP